MFTLEAGIYSYLNKLFSKRFVYSFVAIIMMTFIINKVIRDVSPAEISLDFLALYALCFLQLIVLSLPAQLLH